MVLRRTPHVVHRESARRDAEVHRFPARRVLSERPPRARLPAWCHPPGAEPASILAKLVAEGRFEEALACQQHMEACMSHSKDLAALKGDLLLWRQSIDIG